MSTSEKRLIGLKEVMRMLGLGRPAATLLVMALPHIVVGRRRFVLQSDVEKFIEEATKRGLNITTYAKRVIAEKRAAGLIEDIPGGRRPMKRKAAAPSETTAD